jgi:hypothetical protein
MAKVYVLNVQRPNWGSQMKGIFGTRESAVREGLALAPMPWDAVGAFRDSWMDETGDELRPGGEEFFNQDNLDILFDTFTVEEVEVQP